MIDKQQNNNKIINVLFYSSVILRLEQMEYIFFNSSIDWMHDAGISVLSTRIDMMV